MRQTNADWSTINLGELTKLPVYHAEQKGYRLQDDSGNGCAGDPPGYPTYYTQSVYEASGNAPSRGYSTVIKYNGATYGIEPSNWTDGETWETHQAKHDALMRRLWVPLPLDHPRTQAWIVATFKHHRHCYQVPALRAQGKNRPDAMLVWPGGTLGKTPYGTIRNPAWEVEYAQKHLEFHRWTDAHKAAFLKEIEQGNAHIKVACDVVAIPENHDGTILVRRYYPEFHPTQKLISGELPVTGNWWEVLAVNPGPDKCPGQYSMVHPCNGSWCQFCGWTETEEHKQAA